MNESNKEEAIVTKIKDYLTAFGSESGKRVLADLMKFGNMLGPSFATDPYRTAFNEGRRDVALYILNQLNYDLEKLRQHMQGEE